MVGSNHYLPCELFTDIVHIHFLNLDLHVYVHLKRIHEVGKEIF